MKISSCIALFCLLGLASLANANIEVLSVLTNPSSPTFEGDARLLQSTTTCRFFLLSHEHADDDETGSVANLIMLRVSGPPFQGSVDTLNFVDEGLSYHHDLARIVYEGNNCDCTVTVHRGLNGEGKSKNYLTSGQLGKFDLGRCWADRAESLSIVCNA